MFCSYTEKFGGTIILNLLKKNYLFLRNKKRRILSKTNSVSNLKKNFNIRSHKTLYTRLVSLLVHEDDTDFRQSVEVRKGRR